VEGYITADIVDPKKLPTIYCPYYEKEEDRHRFRPESREAEDGKIIHFCGHCDKVISVESPPNKRALSILYRLSNKFGLEQ
jgi:hypothetical protein